MVKLKLGAIKGSSQPDKASAGKTSSADSGVVKKTVAATTQSQQPASTIKKSISPIVENTPTPGDINGPKDAPERSKLSLGGIRKQKKEVVAEVVVEKKQEIFPIGASCELKNIELFPAYTSKFKKKQGSLLEEIKKIKRLPKTNKIFLITLIGATVGGVAMLFILAPEKHNLNYYKTSLIDAYDEFKNPTPEIIVPPTPIHKPEPVDNIDEENITPPKETEQLDNREDNNNSTTKDGQYYRKIKQQILGLPPQAPQIIDSTSGNISETFDDLSENENTPVNNEVLTEISDEIIDDTESDLEGTIVATGSLNETQENNIDEFDDSFEGGPDEIDL